MIRFFDLWSVCSFVSHLQSVLQLQEPGFICTCCCWGGSRTAPHMWSENIWIAPWWLSEESSVWCDMQRSCVSRAAFFKGQRDSWLWRAKVTFDIWQIVQLHFVADVTVSRRTLAWRCNWDRDLGARAMATSLVRDWKGVWETTWKHRRQRDSFLFIIPTHAAHEQW